MYPSTGTVGIRDPVRRGYQREHIMSPMHGAIRSRETRDWPRVLNLGFGTDKSE